MVPKGPLRRGAPFAVNSGETTTTSAQILSIFRAGLCEDLCNKLFARNITTLESAYNLASEKEQSQSENAKETNLDLSLGLKAHDDDHENDPRAAVGSFGQPEKLSSVDGTGIKPSANSESESRKRKSSSATNLEMRM
ncbi:hypothetical protein M5K25_013565 [Dendrobium thyrsiflorum]|uniref:Uncharacterized protein n=1 Tax=Dendrobium thyrsiflorum TaxID=117978 RepID=A0ABD0UTD0_DENTH